jgi:GIY-YIG catalytic domain
MNEEFRQHIEALQPAIDRLLSSASFTFATLPPAGLMPKAGVYLFSEGRDHLYVGRSNNIRRRLQDHCRAGSGHGKAAFAFLLARIAHGALTTYRTEGGRAQLEADPQFRLKFGAAKCRLRSMDIRFVSEEHPLRQALLEMYVAIALPTMHNDFDNH